MLPEALQDPTFWTAVAFVICVGAIFVPAKKALLGALDSRAERIKQQLDEAQSLREDTQSLLAEYKRKQRDVIEDSAAILEHAKEEAGRLREQAATDLEALLDRRRREAVEKIEQAEAAALKAVRDQAVDVAMAATAKLLAESVDQAKADSLVEAAIGDLPGKLH